MGRSVHSHSSAGNVQDPLSAPSDCGRTGTVFARDERLYRTLPRQERKGPPLRSGSIDRTAARVRILCEP